MSREGSYVLDIAKDDTSARTYAVRRWYKYHKSSSLYKDPKRAPSLAQRPRAELAGDSETAGGGDGTAAGVDAGARRRESTPVGGDGTAAGVDAGAGAGAGGGGGGGQLPGCEVGGVAAAPPAGRGLGAVLSL